MPRGNLRSLAVLTAVGGCLLLAAPAPAQKGAAEQLSFGVKMARRGLWSEALFRFQQAAAIEPANARVLNNLAVAFEASGEFDQALESYQKALQLDPGSRELKQNYTRFVEFYQSFKGASAEPGAAAADDADAADSAADEG